MKSNGMWINFEFHMEKHGFQTQVHYPVDLNFKLKFVYYVKKHNVLCCFFQVTQ